MENKFIQAMDDVSNLNDTHGVKQKGGKNYTEVAKRVEAFRREFGGELGINTNIILNDGNAVIIKAEVRNADGFIIGSGLAEEIRNSSYITRTSAVEVCETSAIGRALASLGLHGGQYASANEMVGVDRKKEAIKQLSTQEPNNFSKVMKKSELEDEKEPEKTEWNIEKFPRHSDFANWIENKARDEGASWLNENLDKIRGHRNHVKAQGDNLNLARIDVILENKGIKI